MRYAALLAGLLAISTPLAAEQDEPYQAWGRVLARFVNERGQVDFRALARERADLDAFVAYVARVSPGSARASFPDREAKLAYYINAYNALAMLNVIDSGFPESLTSLSKVWFFAVKRFAVGGERMSLYDSEGAERRRLPDSGGVAQIGALPGRRARTAAQRSQTNA